jgi:glycosyltransferase involved in cell wall biosynthesis
MNRPHVAGKSIRLDENRAFRVRGVTYGTFKPAPDGTHFPDADQVSEDLKAMADSGFNTVRTYTVPPRWLLDQAGHFGLRLMVGLPWEQHIAFLDDPGRPEQIVTRVVEGVQACRDHPAVLCYAIGNEIPAPIVRWHGRRPIERFIRRLYDAAKREDPDALVTYVNYPTTEYLQLPFLDLHCYNVFLEQPAQLRRYLARLQNISGDKPLVLAEIGLDSRRNGLDGQAVSLAWQLDTAILAGCAGAVVFAWTDEWYRGGEEIRDWDFGLTDRLREPKPALRAASRALSRQPADMLPRAPRISVAVCAHNAQQTIGACLAGIQKLNYPDYEVIVVDDGSGDRTADIAETFSVRLIRKENGGLSNARNTALAHATGDIIAYIDSDAYPDPDWLAYLAEAHSDGTYMAVGGPNILPPEAGDLEECVANSPGGPVHVLLDDEHAEHIPGCNMSFRVDALREIGGFDGRFKIAGDDVDICWRIQDSGGLIGFRAAAAVFHRRRGTVWGYLKQQLNYGRAEAMLERKWPSKYNEFGHPTWSGRIYGNGHTLPVTRRRWHVYYGVRGSAPFQPAVENGHGPLGMLPLMPEWYLMVGGVAILSLLGLLWQPLLLLTPVLAALVGVVLAQAFVSARHADLRRSSPNGWSNLRRRATVAFLHLTQPIARLTGRVGYDLTPWMRRGVMGVKVPRPRVLSLWSERWHSPQTWLDRMDNQLRHQHVIVRPGGPHDRWDLEAWCGLLGGVRVLLTSEEHDAGKQLVRLRIWPRFATKLVLFMLVLASLALGAALDGAVIVTVLLGAALVLVSVRLVFEQGAAMRSVVECMEELRVALNAVPIDIPRPAQPDRNLGPNHMAASVREAGRP